MNLPPDDPDPWSWVTDPDEAPPAPDVSGAFVSVVVVTHNGERWLDDLLDSLLDQTLPPDDLVVVDAGSVDQTPSDLATAHAQGLVDAVVTVPAGTGFGEAVRAGLAEASSAEFLWLLHDDVVARPDALERLVARLSLRPDADAAAPLLLQPHRRDTPAPVAELGQTVTPSGVVLPVVGPGVIDQGQLDADDTLGASVCGLLMRRSAWEAIGLNDDVASAAQGIEFGWLSRASGRGVVAEPAAKLVHWEASTRRIRPGAAADPILERRRWGMALAEAFGPGGGRRRARALGVASALGRMALHALGKDGETVRVEARALRHRPGKTRAALVERFRAVAGESPVDVAGLRPTRRESAQFAFDDAFARAGAWGAGFAETSAEPGRADTDLDELTGDDFAGRDEHRTSAWLAAFVVLVLGAVAASWRLFLFGPLIGPQLLPAPGQAELLRQAVGPVPGVDPSSGPPWETLLWLASWVTLGHPQILTDAVLLGGVPLAFLLARRVLRRVLADRHLALAGGVLYALVPVLTGAVGSGQVATVAWALLLPVLANQLVTWWIDRRPGWPVVGRFALTLLAMTAIEPLTWPLGALVAIAFAIRGASGWLRPVAAVLGPAGLALSPWTLQLLAAPGRLLTGAEPALAPTRAPALLDLALGRPEVTGLPPWWLSAAVVGALWALALVGAGRRPARACAGLAVAGLGFLAAAVLTRLAVAVPLGGEVRPQASAWVVLALGGLIAAGCVGVDGLGAIRRQRLGRASAWVAGVVAFAAAALAGGWWVVDGLAPLQRCTDGLPPFVRRVTESGAGRALALRMDEGRVSWSLIEGDGVRLGASERGFALGGDPGARTLAASLAQGIATGASDDSIVPRLRSLGVSHVWVTNSTAAQRTIIGNVPGLGSGSGDSSSATWTVPGGGRAVLVTGNELLPVSPGDTIAAGQTTRRLELAETPDPRWWATLGGRRLERIEGTGVQFVVPEGGGLLEVGLDAPTPWWAWGQAGWLALVALLAAPTLRPPTQAPARPRHARRES